MGGDSDSDIVSLSATTACAGVVLGVRNEVHVLFELTTGHKAATVQRPPIDIALVLDKSGSMAGRKLQFAKDAVRRVVAALGSRDTVHLIAYDTRVTTVFEGARGGDTSLFAAVDAIAAGTSTNISGGLERAQAVLTSSSGAPNKRVFLFSDGLANAGVTSNEGLFELAEALHSSGIVVSAYGVGDDFNEQLMRGIAESGRGDYAFIDTEENIPKFVQHGLRGILSCIGTNGLLRLRGRNGGVVQRVYGHDGDELVRGVRLDDIREDNHKQILAVLDVAPAGAVAAGSRAPVIEWELTYKPVDRPLAGYETLRGAVEMLFTESDAAALATPAGAEKVLVALQIQHAAARDREIVALLDANKVDEAIALKERSLAALAEWEGRDSSGFIKSILRRGASTLTEMRQRTNIPKMRKFVDYEAEMGDNMSACSLQFHAEDHTLE
eukprot:TRINITY_DN3102_c0_g1_i1.p1 TRINITY_DN3102_c0_g1~~TRINITY_DN3102_c0_g1_i1.p1  ORF type:complete len:440 (-),score=99.87 TRINITY_DN3102_c0_g1_i1:20-1339(-)